MRHGPGLLLAGYVYSGTTNAFLAKPLGLDDLIAVVRQGLQERRSPGEDAPLGA
jgi:hypothetical protein